MQTRFKRGDLVRLKDDLGAHKEHFSKGVFAIVCGSYADQFGGNDHSDYTLFIKDRGEESWFQPQDFDLVEPGRIDLLGDWIADRQARQAKVSDLDWIFANGEAVLASWESAAVAALAKEFGLDNLWGSRGEGVTYCLNAYRTMRLAAPFLAVGDKDGYLAECSRIKMGLSDADS